ncbi:hypothetical protein BU14_1906s0001, partial [Porphyra umbilicalis]
SPLPVSFFLFHVCGVPPAQWCVGYGHWMFLAGLVAAVAAAAGMVHRHALPCWDQVWIAHSERLAEDRAVFAQLFDGLDRQLAVAVTSPDTVGAVARPGAATNSVASAEALGALLYVTTAIYNNVSVAARVRGGGTVELTVDDFCQRPLVPPTYRPPVVNASGGPPDWRTHGAYQAFAYGALTRCLATRDALVILNGSAGGGAVDPAALPAGAPPVPPPTPVAVSLEPLPATWGIPAFPCERVSALDCFGEGGDVGYPPALAALQRVAAAVNLSRTLCLGNDSSACPYSGCMADLQTQLNGSVAGAAGGGGAPPPAGDGGGGGGSVPVAAAGADPGAAVDVRAILDELSTTTVLRFATWGYAARPRFRNMNPTEVQEHLARALTSTRAGNVSAASCAAWDSSGVNPSSFLGHIRPGVAGRVESIGALRTVVTTRNGSEWAFSFHPDSTAVTANASRAYDFAVSSPLVGATANAAAAAAAGDVAAPACAATRDLWGPLLRLEAATVRALAPAFDRAAGSRFGAGEEFAPFYVRHFVSRMPDDTFAVTAARGPSPLLLGAATAATVPVVVLSLSNCARPLGARNLVCSRVGLGSAGVGVLALSALASAGLAVAVGLASSPLALHLGPPGAIVLGAVDVFMLITAAMATGVAGGGRGLKAGGRMAVGGAGGGGGGSSTHRSGRASRDSGDSAIVHVADVHGRLYMAAAAAVPPSVVASVATVASLAAASAISSVPAARTYGGTLAVAAAVGGVARLVLLLPLAAWDVRRVVGERLDLAPFYRVPLDDGTIGGEGRCWSRSLTTGRLAAVARDYVGCGFLFRGGNGGVALSTLFIAIAAVGTTVAAGIAATRVVRGVPAWRRVPARSPAAEYMRLDAEHFQFAPAWLVSTAGGTPASATSGASFSTPDRQRALLARQTVLQGVANVSLTPSLEGDSWYGPAAGSLLAYSAAASPPNGSGPPRGGGLELYVPPEVFSDRLIGWASGVGAPRALDVFCFDTAVA